MTTKRLSLQSSLRSTLSFAALGIAFVGAGCASAQQLERGEELYGFCAQCHGPEAHGIRDVNAPGLTNLDDWYLERQLEQFSAAMRGRPDRDVHESPMIFVARAYDEPQAMADLVAYIASLPDYEPTISVMGDVTAGRQLYSACDS
ncbi:MAG: c-type cytochrome, partial [Gammaproteobacteria bacterium]|nr:c-type cytochrome [Gammaproteobacteria bacterium]